MNGTLYFGLLLTALCSVSECARHRYYFVNIDKTWTEAQNYCRENYKDLATVTNKEDMQQLIKSVNTTLDVWIGLKHGENSNNTWKWSLGDPVTYKNWANNTSDTNQMHCAYMAKQGKWNYSNCNMNFSFVCYNESSKDYIVETSQKTWSEAQRFCREHHSDLTSVRNETENEKIKKKINDNNVWIGLFRGSWMWSDNSSSTFRYWDINEPNGGELPQCTEVYLASTHANMERWNDAACSASRTFVCHGQDTLILVKENLSWPDALMYCRTNHVDLVSVDSDEIQGWVTEVVRNASTAEVWLGLRYSCQVGIWFWVNGEIACYHNWDGNVEENCNTGVRSGAVQSGNQRWISRPETDKLNFICTKEN